MRATIIIAIAALVPMGALAAGSGATCSPERLAFCKSQGMDDNGFGPAWLHNHCKRSPYGPRYEYLVPTWQCLHQP